MRKVIVITLLTLIIRATHAQDLGLSFSYFLPKNGYFSTPISPFSLRGVGFNFGKYLGVQTGASLYRMSGMNVIGIPFESEKPIIGPTFTLLVPLEFVIQVGNDTQEFSVKGGAFAFYSFDQKINEGNLDRAIRTREVWDVANSDFSIENKLGYGYQFGVEYMFYVTKQVAISLEGNYYIGGANLSMKGSYIGGNMTGDLIIRDNRDYPDSRIDFTGLEISMGFVYSAGRR